MLFADQAWPLHHCHLRQQISGQPAAPP